MWGDWRGRAPEQPQEKAPCGACGEPGLDRHRFAFAGWLAHTECAVHNVRGASDRGDDCFGVAIRGGGGPPRRRTFRLTEMLPRICRRYDGDTEWGVHRRRQLALSWPSATSDGEEATNLTENQQAEGTVREEAGVACTFYGLDLENPAPGSVDNHMRVPVLCPHRGFVHFTCMLERADRLARGHIEPRSSVACSFKWAGGSRSPHPAELAGDRPMTESGGRWTASRNTMHFADLLQWDVPGPGPASYLTTGVYDSFELMVHFQPLRSSCAPCLAMLWACLERLTLISVTRRNGRCCRPLPCAVRRVRDPIAECLVAVNKPAALHRALGTSNNTWQASTPSGWNI